MPIREASPREASLHGSPRICRGAAGGRPAGCRGRPRTAPASNRPSGFDSRDWLTQATGEMRDSFARNRRVISFAEYVTLFSAEPARQLRSAAQYVRDVFDHFGTEPVRTPRGPMTRWKLFDCPWDNGKDALVGQEEVQAAVYRLVANFAREGRTNRLILLHGPNGSAKSTFVACLQRAMEHYSTLEDGALYKFNWIFPSQKLTKGGIGFGGGHRVGRRAGDLRLSRRRADRVEDRRRDARSPALAAAAGQAAGAGHRAARLRRPAGAAAGRLSGARRFVAPQPPDLRGAAVLVPRRLSARCCATCRSSASSSRAATAQAAATVEPQLAVDARSRQLTMDRSLASLPPALQSLTLYEYQGELVDGNRGVDRLRRSAQAAARVVQVPARHGGAGAGLARRRQPGARHRLHRLVQRGLPGGVQGDPRVPVVQGADGAGARALPARLPGRAADLPGADPGRAHRVGPARGAARRLGDRAVGGAHADEEAAGREVRQGAVRHRRQAGADGEGAALRRRRHARGAHHRAAARSRRPGSRRSPASRTATPTTRGAPAPRRAR